MPLRRGAFPRRGRPGPRQRALQLFAVRAAAILAPSAFVLLQGEDALAEYRFGRGVARHRFCRHCGVHVFAQNHVEALGGDYISLSLTCLDVAPQWLAAVPITYLNGFDEDWTAPPAVTAHM